MKLLYTKFLIVTLILFSGFSYAQSNQYLHFDGIDDYTELVNGAQYVNGKNTITMAGWFYTDELIYGQGMMSIRAGGTGTGEMYLIQLNNGTLECRVITNTGLHQVVGPAGTVQAGVWQHIAWVFNQNAVQLYVDGNLIGSSTASGTFFSTDKPFSIGKCILPGFNFVFKGRADEVSLWSKALTASEIQDMMQNELTGDESELQVYYKFNQGTPGGNNTNITQLNEFSGNTTKNSILHNFALLGETSNFNGILEDGAQTINFPFIPNKLITDAPFELEATTNSGLPVSFEIVSGPASISGTTLTLDGIAGTVVVKASQAGDENYDPAEDVTVSFDVLDPNGVLVNTEILHPISANVYAPSLMPIKIAVRAGIEYPELFDIGSVTVTVDDDEVELVNHQNGFYTGWWTPDSYGNHELVVSSTNNFGAVGNISLTFNLQQNAQDITVNGTTQAWVKADIPVVIVESDLPSHIGAYDQILGTLIIDCPTGGCDPWDRVSSVEAQGKDGKWFEIIRYLTPYGVACQSEIDLTDFASLLMGKTKFRVTLGTQGNGFLYTLQLNYKAGTAEYPYSTVEKLWYNTYQFGDMANLQPAEQFTGVFPENTTSAKIKLVSTGHGWGDNNTGNAAEFQPNTHHIWVNNQQTFSQYNWKVCNPNPDGCSPQAGTWFYNRAGWCPGSIAQFFDYSLASYVNQNDITLNYKFDQSYVDYCHPNNPNCITGTTCPDCNDGFNPHLIVASYLISFGNAPLGTTLGVKDASMVLNTKVYPNPSFGTFFIDFDPRQNVDKVTVYDIMGRIIKSQNITSLDNPTQVNLDGQASGVYILKITNGNKIVDTKRIIIE